MILRGHNLFLASFAGGTLCFSAGNFGTWFAKQRPSPKSMGFKKITEDISNAGELFKLVLKEQKGRVEERFGKNIRDESVIREWCITNADKPWVNDYRDALDFCYIPKKVAYRLVSEGYRIKDSVFSPDHTDQKCAPEKIWDYVSDGAQTVNYLQVKGDCIEGSSG